MIKAHDEVLSGGLLGKIRGQEHWAAFSFPLSGPVLPPGCRGGQRETGARDVSAVRAQKHKTRTQAGRDRWCMRM